MAAAAAATDVGAPACCCGFRSQTYTCNKQNNRGDMMMLQKYCLLVYSVLCCTVSSHNTCATLIASHFEQKVTPSVLCQLISANRQEPTPALTLLPRHEATSPHVATYLSISCPCCHKASIAADLCMASAAAHAACAANCKVWGLEKLHKHKHKNKHDNSRTAAATHVSNTFTLSHLDQARSNGFRNHRAWSWRASIPLPPAC